MSKVSTPCTEYLDRLTQIQTMRHVIEGVDAVKAHGSRYLPYPQPVLSADSAAVKEAKEARYVDYKLRANFVNFTTRTHDGLNGSIHRLAPTYVLPDRISYLADSADGAGLNISSMAKSVTGELLAVGRIGILADYPQSEPGSTAEQTAGLQATLSTYPYESIINWRSNVINGKRVLTLVVMVEADNKELDEFTEEKKLQYRVLQLIEGVYSQSIYDHNGEIKGIPRTPKDGQGKTFSEIPFVFAGAYNNGPATDVPPLYDMAQLNIGHYRNSADYEEAIFIAGQPTLFLASEMTTAEFIEANPTGVHIGARAGHFLGKNGNAVLLQARETNMAQKGMQDKQEQMIMIGAKLVQSAKGNETAEAAHIRASGEVSVLTTLVGNASSAMLQALGWADRFMGGDGSSIEFAINNEFFAETIDATQIASMINLVDQGHIAQVDLRSKLRRAGWVASDRSDEMIDADIIAAGGLGETGADDENDAGGND